MNEEAPGEPINRLGLFAALLQRAPLYLKIICILTKLKVRYVVNGNKV